MGRDGDICRHGISTTHITVYLFIVANRIDFNFFASVAMRSAIFLAPLLAALSTAQHVHYDIPEVDHYVQSMLGEYHQYASLPTGFVWY